MHRSWGAEPTLDFILPAADIDGDRTPWSDPPALDIVEPHPLLSWNATSHRISEPERALAGRGHKVVTIRLRIEPCAGSMVGPTNHPESAIRVQRISHAPAPLARGSTGPAVPVPYRAHAPDFSRGQRASQTVNRLSALLRLW